MLDHRDLCLLSEAINFCHSISLFGRICDDNNEYDSLMEFYACEMKDIPCEVALDSKIELCREDDYNEEDCSKIKVKEFIDLWSNINDYVLVDNSIVYGKNMALFFMDSVDDYTVAKLVKILLIIGATQKLLSTQKSTLLNFSQRDKQFLIFYC